MEGLEGSHEDTVYFNPPHLGLLLNATNVCLRVNKVKEIFYMTVHKHRRGRTVTFALESLPEPAPRPHQAERSPALYRLPARA